MEFLNNPWFIGIGGGIISGLLVTLVSRALFSRRDQREYAQKTSAANREVVYAVRPGISEGWLPTPEILDSILRATARKFGVDRKDLYSPTEVAQELMKEVMDSSFISAKAKQDYCSSLVPLTLPTLPSPDGSHLPSTDLVPKTQSAELEEYRSRMVSTMSVMLGVLTAAMTIVLALSSEGRLSSFTADSGERLTTLFLPMAISLGAVTIVTLGMILTRDLRKRSDEGSQKPDSDLSTPASRKP